MYKNLLLEDLLEGKKIHQNKTSKDQPMTFR